MKTEKSFKVKGTKEWKWNIKNTSPRKDRKTILEAKAN